MALIDTLHVPLRRNKTGPGTWDTGMDFTQGPRSSLPLPWRGSKKGEKASVKARNGPLIPPSEMCLIRNKTGVSGSSFPKSMESAAARPQLVLPSRRSVYHSPPRTDLRKASLGPQEDPARRSPTACEPAQTVREKRPTPRWSQPPLTPAHGGHTHALNSTSPLATQANDSAHNFSGPQRPHL